MRLDEVYLKNYRCFSELHLRLDPQFNILVGINGSGKTSILQGIVDAMGALYLNPDPEGPERIEVVRANGRISFERQYPVRAIAVTTGWPWQPKLTFSRERVSLGAPWSTNPPPQDIRRDVRWPILANYPANRHWSRVHPSEMQAATERQAREDGYSHWWNASSTLDLEVWVIGKCLERFQESSESGRSFDNYDDDDLALVNDALSRAVPELRGLRYDLKEKALLVELVYGLTLFDNLSHGQRAVTCLVADIARRMCLLNPQLGPRATLETPGVVLVDELDLHLHPAWQRSLTVGLKEAFPQVQFIAASHSPQVLGELRPEQIILLQDQGTGHPQVSYGLDASAVLEIIMGTPPRAPEIQELLDSVFSLLEQGRLDEAECALRALRDKAPGLPELARAGALLKRKQLLGK